MAQYTADVVVVGAGIAGLWIAKELVDAGLSVDVYEATSTLAHGATTRNEGRLLTGSYHAVAIYDETEARRVTEHCLYGHRAVMEFAPESVEEEASFALFSGADLVSEALGRWASFGVAYDEVSSARFKTDGIDVSRICAAFSVHEKSVNSRIIVDKLAEHIVKKGGRIFTHADVTPESATTANLKIRDTSHTITAQRFIVAAGSGAKRVFGNALPMRFFKSHLLITPQLTDYNAFYIDPYEAGIMRHGAASIVGINRDAIETEVPNYDVVPEKEQLLRDALQRMIPSTGRLRPEDVKCIACIKPDIDRSQGLSGGGVLQDLSMQLFEQREGWLCALPGKMTQSPVLAHEVAERILRSGVKPILSGRSPVSLTTKSQLRPVDEWMAK